MSDFFAFRRMLAPVLVQIIWWFFNVAIILVGLGISGGRVGLEGILSLVGIVPLLIINRIVAELFMLPFSMNETLTDIRTNTQNRPQVGGP